MSKGILQYLKREGYDVPDANFYSYIKLWRRWYQGKTAFHAYRVYNGSKHVNKTRKTMGMAKRIPEDWANLLLNEKVEIVVNENQQESLNAVLDANNFRVRGNQLVELAFALGTGAFVEFKDKEDNVNIDYIRADMIFPLRYENNEITACAFASESGTGNDRYVYLNIHEKNERGQYVIKSAYFKKQNDTLQQIDLPEGIEEKINTQSEVPFFQIIKPNIVNNIDLDNPMGISVYANAVDQMEGLDLVYDSYCNEFQLGKKRIVVPVKMARIQMDDDGITKPMFDYNDTEFYAISGVDEGMGIKEINMSIRAADHETGFKTALNVLAKKCGLGDTYYDFEAGGVKTATEIVSEESDLFRNLKKHELILRQALTGLVQAVAALKGLNIDDIAINFDDSIIEDTGAEKERFLQEIRDGVRQKWEYRVRFFGETEEEAKANVPSETDDTWVFEE